MFKKAYFVILSILICERLDHAIQPELSNVQVAIKTLNLPSPPAPNPGWQWQSGEVNELPLVNRIRRMDGCLSLTWYYLPSSSPPLGRPRRRTLMNTGRGRPRSSNHVRRHEKKEEKIEIRKRVAECGLSIGDLQTLTPQINYNGNRVVRDRLVRFIG